MTNAMVRGTGDNQYVENYAGSESLSETVPTSALTGTLATTVGLKTVTGTGTAFKTELFPGQFVLFDDSSSTVRMLMVVDTIASNTSFTMVKSAIATVSGKTGYRLPVLFELSKKRGTLIRGNAIEFDQGSILAIGDGTLRVNGAVLPGTSLTLSSRKPKLAVLNAATGNYAVYAFGMTTPAAPTVAGIAGGTLNMQDGSYGIILAPSRTATGGFNNGSIQTVTALGGTGNKFQVNDPGFDTAHGQDAWDVYGTLFNQGNIPPANGPWYFVTTITAANISAGVFTVEWLDGQINRNKLLTGDNDPPPDAGYVAALDGQPVYVSCSGPGDTAPGPVLFTTLPNNPEAVPADQPVPLSPPETILGVIGAQGRLFLMTPNTLQIASSIPDAPFILTRPYWKTGFKNAYSLIFHNGTLYGCPSAGPTRSIADGDEGSEEQNFAADVEEITRDWIPGQVLVAHDPKNDAICFFHAGDSVNTSGYLTTRILVYGLRQNAWISDITLEALTSDFIVSGVATVNGYLEFLGGGRTILGTMLVNTYRFDTSQVSVVDYRVAWAFTDSDAEDRDKRISSIHLTAKTTTGSMGVFGAGATQSIPVASLSQGPGASLSGAISIPNTSTVTRSQRYPINVPRVSQWTVQVAGTYPGTGNLDRIDEVVAEVAIQGARR
jgi:hypothetical protein